MPPAQPSSGQLLTDHLRRWSGSRAHQRAFTFVEFPEPGSPGIHRSIGWQLLDTRARTIAARLSGTASPGDRAALLLPQGLDYVAAFLGCLYASVIAVPLFGPELPGHAGRLTAVLEDCEPVCLLTDTPGRAGVEAFVADRGLPPVPVLAVDERPGLAPVPEDFPRPEPEDIAYLQYTSGSTRTPAGVMITHGNVLANADQALTAVDAFRRPTTTVGWLPLFHDMGLLLSIAAPVVGGFPSVLMDPVSFLEDPARWLRMLGGYPGTVSAAPNFAYDYCAARAGRDRDESDELGELSLDRVRVLLNGSEPVRPGTVRRFQQAFADTGLRPEAHCPAYGLAEATVFVTSDPFTTEPAIVHCDPAALAEGRIEAADPDDPAAARLVECGAPVGQEVRIADPETGSALAEGGVGEILVRGPNVGLGYWKRTGRSAENFDQALPGEPGAGWLRTGDLGAVHGGRLLVTGRLKDLIIVDGRNHYPQDIEETVQSALPTVRRDRLAVFSVPNCEDEEDVVVVAEYRRETVPTPGVAREAVRTARTAVSARHGLRLSDLRLVAPGCVPRTSSGKISRAACRLRWLEGAFAAPDTADLAPEEGAR